jgi:hypothetical protein
MFMLSFFEVPRGVLEKIDYFRSTFYWQSYQHKKKYRLTRWNIICQPKDQGGLGILNIDVQNRCLLSKWLFKLINEDGLWQNMLRRKYGNSHFWSGLMRVKESFMSLGHFKLNSGENIRF